MTQTVHHYYPFGSGNVGDHLVARALRLALPRHFGPLHFVPMPVNDRYRGADRTIGLLGENVDRSNAEADLVVVGGSNLLEPRKPRRVGLFRRGPMRWGVFTDLTSLDRLQSPTLLVGMGTGSDHRQRILRYAEPALSEVRRLHDKSFAAAVRDVATTRELGRIGLDVPCVGCPVTFMTDRPVTNADERLPLIVSFPPTELQRSRVGRKFLQMTRQYLEWLQGRKVRFLVSLHDSRDLKDAPQWIPEGVEVFFSDDVEAIVERYEACRGVVGFRLHAALLGLGLGKPIVPIAVDWRGLGFIETFGLDAFAIRARRRGEFPRLLRATELLLAGDETLVGLLAKRKREFGARYHSFLAGAAARFRSIRRAA